MINKQELLNLLHTENVVVTFKKVNGEFREMTCTLRSESIPVVESDKPKQKHTPNPEVCPVYDTKAQGWRSFRFDSIINVNGDPYRN